MGVYVGAYRKLRAIDRELTQYGALVDGQYNWKPITAVTSFTREEIEFTDRRWPGGSEGIKPDQLYTYAESSMFRAYGGYTRWRLLLHEPAFAYVTVVAALVLGSHAMHDSFAVIRWTEAGISPATTGLLWSESVAAEVVVFFVVGPSLLRTLGPTGALAIAAAAGVLRWVVMALTAEVAVLAMIQPLHGLTFALLHLACMRIITAAVPAALAGTAQAVYGLIGVCGATALLTIFSGWLYGRFGADGFWVMALLCSLAFPVIRMLQNALAMPDAVARYG